MAMLRGAICLVAALSGLAGTAVDAAAQVASADATRLSFDEAVKAASELPRIHSLLVSVRGSLVLERYFNGRRATSPANIKSASKSIISALVGIAVDRGFISNVEQPIGSSSPMCLEPLTIRDARLRSKIF